MTQQELSFRLSLFPSACPGWSKISLKMFTSKAKLYINMDVLLQGKGGVANSEVFKREPPLKNLLWCKIDLFSVGTF